MPLTRTDASTSRISPTPEPPPRSPLADGLCSPDGDGRRDVEIVFGVLSYYRSRYGGFPGAEDNATFLSALAGRNPGRLELIPRSHSAVSTKGELLDRWGTPFFFHLVSSQTMEVRSAGPDRAMFTADDFVTGNRRGPVDGPAPTPDGREAETP